MAGVSKASKPKALATPRSRSAPRAPLRDRGIQRHAALLDATERLLVSQSPDDVGLYQIAEAADVPPASVYHFFPTKDAAFLALAQRYLDGFVQLNREPVEAKALKSWQDHVEIDLRRTMLFYNARPPAMKIFYGGYGSLAIREADIRFTSQIAQSAYDRLNQVFHMPFVAEAEKKFQIALAIMDAIWGLSYVRNGKITEDFFLEALDAYVAYCRLFLPHRVDLRANVRYAAERGEEIVLHDILSLAEPPDPL